MTVRFKNLCKIEGCDGPVRGWGWCYKHYLRWKRTGDPEEINRPIFKGSLRDRLLHRVEYKRECWLWTGHRNYSGYGHLYYKENRKISVHRAAYEVFVGPIPEGMEIDHLCEVRHCLNPAHLEAVTHGENLRRKASREGRIYNG